MPIHPHLAHLTPFARHPIVYLTVVTHLRSSILAGDEAFDAITSIWRRSPEADGWFVGDFLLMPDHAHLFAKPDAHAKSLAGWVATWKSLSARVLLPAGGSLWQKDYFDRFIRSQADYAEKWEYVQANPVRAGLCARPEDWPWKGRLNEICFSG